VINKGFFLYGDRKILRHGGTVMKTTCEERKEIRCQSCETLLAIESDGTIQIRYKKEVNLTVSKDLHVVCRGCGKVHLIRIEKR